MSAREHPVPPITPSAPPAPDPRRATIIIPARLGSTRFPEKVLASRTGKPLVQHVAEAAAAARCANRVVVATDHPRVAAALEPFGTRVLMTSPDHPNGTSRLAEAACLLSLADSDIVVNAQGDEPELAGPVIDAAVDALAASAIARVATAAAPFAPGDDPRDPNIVKVVRTLNGHALYFSRALIPHHRDSGGTGGVGAVAPAGPDGAVGGTHATAGVTPLRHIGVYAYSRGFLETYLRLPPTPCEQAESLEQLRALEHGHAIAVALCTHARPGIDTPEQYDAFVQRFTRAQHR